MFYGKVLNWHYLLDGEARHNLTLTWFSYGPGLVPALGYWRTRAMARTGGAELKSTKTLKFGIFLIVSPLIRSVLSIIRK